MKRIILWVGLLLLLPGCGVQTLVAGRNPVVPEELRSFVQRSWRLTNVRFFLWREDMTAEQVSRAQEIGDRLDELDNAAVPLNAEQLDLENALEPVKESYLLLNRQLRALKKVLKNIAQEVDQDEKAKEAAEKELQALLATPDPDPNQVKTLEQSIVRWQARIDAKTSDLTALSELEEEYQQAVEEKKAERERLEGLLDEVEEQLGALFAEGQAQVDELMTVVDYYKQQPTAVALVLEEDGSTRVEINNWDLGDGQGPRNFSTVAPLTGAPSIRDVSYEARGGEYRFKVDVFVDEQTREEVRETYSFRFSRVKYDAVDGRTFFAGEIRLGLPGQDESETRRGVARLTDRNN